MKKVILILSVITLSISCNKNSTSSKTNSLSPSVVYCVSTEDNGVHISRGCASNKTELQNKTIELRNQGFVSVKSVEKSKCSECQ